MDTTRRKEKLVLSKIKTLVWVRRGNQKVFLGERECSTLLQIGDALCLNPKQPGGLHNQGRVISINQPVDRPYTEVIVEPLAEVLKHPLKSED